MQNGIDPKILIAQTEKDWEKETDPVMRSALACNIAQMRYWMGVSNIPPGGIMSFHNQGIINTGDNVQMRDIQIHINSLNESGAADVGNAIQKLSDEISASKDISDEQKRDLGDQVESLAKEAATPLETRAKPGVVKGIINSLVATISVAGSLARVWDLVGDHICDHFGIPNPLSKK